MNPLVVILGLGVVGYWYLYPLIALSRLEFKLDKFKVIDITTDNVDFSVSLLIKNNTAYRLIINSVNAEVYVNNKYVSTISTVKDVSVDGNAVTAISANVLLNNSNVIDTIWEDFIKQNFRESNLTFKGNLLANKKNYPFNVTVKITDILS